MRAAALSTREEAAAVSNSSPDAVGAAGVFVHQQRVQPEWIDYNGHLNVAYYVVIFDQATDAVFEQMDMGEAYRSASGCSVFVSEMYVAYRREILGGDSVRVVSRFMQHNASRAVLMHEMFCERLQDAAAINEVLCVHVDLQRRRATGWPPAAAAAIGTCVDAAALQYPDPPVCRIRLDLR
jgi:acyl-CoA thioester hydrolase